ncbi:MAG: type VI secretion system ATPase TssH, partial [Acidobacteriia bacterium]|nr:type VI secretion system ATPase TssH [Terriglobia bacterium]
MIPFERFTQKAQEAVRQTQLLAAEANHQTLQPAHLLAALAAEENGIVQAVLAKLGISATATAARLRPVLDAIPAVSGVAGGTHLDPGSDTHLTLPT